MARSQAAEDSRFTLPNVTGRRRMATPAVEKLAKRPLRRHAASMSFVLHPRLAAGSFELGRIGISRVLLKDNANFPWLLLVPEAPEGIEDLHQLSDGEYADVTAAIRRVSCFMTEHFRPEKLNVACIGNQVRQMHVHLVGRSPSDPAWPGTVWAFDGKRPYEAGAVEAIRAAFQSALAAA